MNYINLTVTISVFKSKTVSIIIMLQIMAIEIFFTTFIQANILLHHILYRQLKLKRILTIE